MNKRSFKWHHLLRMHGFWFALAIGILILFVYGLIYTHSHRSITYQSPIASGPIEVPVQPAPPEKPAPPTALPKAKVSSIIVPSIATGTATVTNASPAVFAYAHGTTQAGERFIIGTADRAGNPYASNRFVMFTDPRFIERYVTMLLPHQGDIETMTYDQASNKVYFLLT